MASSKNSDPLQSSLLAITQTAVGCGIGLLIAGKLGRPAQKTTAATMLSIGALLAMPWIVESVLKRLTGPGSARGERRRLDRIRTDAGYPDDADVF
ncbi:MAG TPA: hypothetical protein VFD27_14970 [Chthoniobacteraceae bacterium]|jgi:hypothetical protein|nr:hypothetical protein [Chthoniobacteraceae bacterium]